MVAEEGAEFQDLPEGCIASVLSLATPRDVCRLSLVCSTFRSAAESDAVWERFLPSDYRTLISQSENASSFSNLTKKDIYLYLSQNPILIDDGKKSFQLDRKSGKKCYMLSSRDLTIIWGAGDTPEYWDWITLPESRFREIAQLHDVCWLEIRGMMNSFALSSNTQYAAYLVFKMINARGFENRPVELSVGIFGGQSSTKIVCLHPASGSRTHSRVVGLQHPNERSDGWLEIEMGEFFNSGLEDEVQMSVKELGGQWKSGLILEGIEVRPKENN